ncbi:DsbA family oxidoreductase [Longimicrobium sp.]|uniref:DsbA family oxidoreductase n=1 Tax=Longimicrobium sp. TaxID=2029185 RepID=UPI002C045236|nr:DsbA family oxidoreductase [Longimicrobium sp.]HSU13136.1 DsbA family oxidoreductase [Longimicrobium sp.]
MIIDLFADIACPWCWIGERRLKRALEARGVEATVRWRPYMLQRNLPPEGIAWSELVEKKFGGWERARPMFAHVANAGAPEGLRYDFESIQRAPNTRDAHRVVLLAQEHGRVWEVADALFSAYFAEGRDINDPEVLVDVASRAGLDAELVREMLASGRFAGDVDATQEVADTSGVNGVPLAVFEGKFGVSGAQPLEVFNLAIDRALGGTAEAA